MNAEPPVPPRHYAWPKYVWGAVLLGILIAVLAMLRESKRIQQMKQDDPLWGADRSASPSQAQ